MALLKAPKSHILSNYSTILPIACGGGSVQQPCNAVEAAISHDGNDFKRVRHVFEWIAINKDEIRMRPGSHPSELQVEGQRFRRVAAGSAQDVLCIEASGLQRSQLCM